MECFHACDYHFFKLGTKQTSGTRYLDVCMTFTSKDIRSERQAANTLVLLSEPRRGWGIFSDYFWRKLNCPRLYLKVVIIWASPCSSLHIHHKCQMEFTEHRWIHFTKQFLSIAFHYLNVNRKVGLENRCQKEKKKKNFNTALGHRKFRCNTGRKQWHLVHPGLL